ncbi:VapE domain-containing protein [Reichenbachiella sp.]|uniref:VapE domain-containing protein n=1 Tax=Reichenbachiella sp. TaxID=2184521 RepID=UPI003BAEB4AF
MRIELKPRSVNSWQPLNENNLYRELQHEGINFSIPNLIALMKSDFVRSYDPFVQYFESLTEWDGKDHIDHFASFIHASDKERFRCHFKKMLVRVVACALNPKVFNKQALILVQCEQNSGKSTLSRFLAPPELSEYVAENIATDKDSLISLCENFIIILDELATMSKLEVNALKSIFSKDKVKVRRPYERKAEMITRRASFIGSTNNLEFLNDETGSVRWLCFEIIKIDWNYSKEVVINKVWSQAYSLYQSGFKYELTTEEIIENDQINKKHQVNTSELELIQQYLKPGSKEQHDEFWNATQVMNYLTAKTERAIPLKLILVGKALAILGFSREQKWNGTYQIKGYYLSYLLTNSAHE